MSLKRRATNYSPHQNRNNALPEPVCQSQYKNSTVPWGILRLKYHITVFDVIFLEAERYRQPHTLVFGPPVRFQAIKDEHFPA
jgi:hypothetical protein